MSRQGRRFKTFYMITTFEFRVDQRNNSYYGNCFVAHVSEPVDADTYDQYMTILLKQE
ncbi:hypothetical protein CU098_007981 [Rhizopus stolonifer]|uniref:Uncharacterized protein n=1 Tax=Rhizopus stolonifer TaxID=4846 RepID=A0A367K1S9_RHIST|nr:hypothetical protein CU098_007981 [Rhizopus stolonifer]